MNSKAHLEKNEGTYFFSGVDCHTDPPHTLEFIETKCTGAFELILIP